MKVLILGPSRAGKSFFSQAFKNMGLPAVDLDADTDLVGWYNDASGALTPKPTTTTHEWLETHHFLIDKQRLHEFLASRTDTIMFGHCWNIMDCLDEFDHVAFMHLDTAELEKRFLAKRRDHKTKPSKAEFAFFRERHQQRQQQAKERDIPFINANQTPEAFYKQLKEIIGPDLLATHELLPTDAKPADREEVARYYLACEFDNIVDDASKAKLRELHGKELWRLLEALSFGYRINLMFHLISDKGFDWYRATLPTTNITLTGMKVPINKVMKLPEVNFDPHKFVSYLRSYFEKHPDDDPDELSELRPRPVPNERCIVTVREKDGKILMVDGSHRLVAQIAAGATEVEVYYARPNGEEHKPMVGDSALVTLREVYKQAQNNNEREAVLSVVRQLFRISVDARDAVADYWRLNEKDHPITQAAEELLKS